MEQSVLLLRSVSEVVYMPILLVVLEHSGKMKHIEFYSYEDASHCLPLFLLDDDEIQLILVGKHVVWTILSGPLNHVDLSAILEGRS